MSFIKDLLPSELIKELKNLAKNTHIEEDLDIKFLPNMDSNAILGKGTRGTAIKLANGKVLKITDDKSEAAVAAQIKNKKIRGIAKYYGAYRLKDNKQPIADEWFGVYFLVMEELTYDMALSTKIIDLLYEIIAMVDEDLVDIDSEYWTDLFHNMAMDASTMFEDASPRLVEYVRDIMYGLRFLNQNKIQYHDVHKGNILFRTADRSAVLIDFGYSSGGKGKILTFENKQGVK